MSANDSRHFEFTSLGTTLVAEVTGQYRSSRDKDLSVRLETADAEIAYRDFTEIDCGAVEDVMAWAAESGFRFTNKFDAAYACSYIASVLLESDDLPADLNARAVKWTDEDIERKLAWYGVEVGEYRDYYVVDENLGTLRQVGDEVEIDFGGSTGGSARAFDWHDEARAEYLMAATEAHAADELVREKWAGVYVAELKAQTFEVLKDGSEDLVFEKLLDRFVQPRE